MRICAYISALCIYFPNLHSVFGSHRDHITAYICFFRIFGYLHLPHSVCVLSMRFYADMCLSMRINWWKISAWPALILTPILIWLSWTKILKAPQKIIICKAVSWLSSLISVFDKGSRGTWENALLAVNLTLLPRGAVFTKFGKVATHQFSPEMAKWRPRSLHLCELLTITHFHP